jgi:hypothetical protein
VAEPEVPSGIGGWLVLPLLGLVLTPLRISFSLYKDMWPIFSEGYWGALTTSTSEAYHPYWAPLLVFEIAGNVLLVVATLALLYFFLGKSKYAPRLMIGWLAFILVFNGTDFFAASLIPAVAALDDSESAKELGRAAIGAVIWIPYFLVSKRVKATFVK